MRARVSRPVAIVAEDHDEMRALIAKAVERAGYDVIAAANGLALATEVIARDAPPDLIVCDVRMPWAGGLAVLDALDRRRSDRVPAIVVTAFPDESLRARIAARPSTHLLEKPFDLAALTNVAAAFRSPQA
jgi:CheY-like chemotaxis protein